ncbi:ketoacyl-ACP synthase III family protein [Micromonospora sp. NPDC048871]|uniref:ketoacyl-ACP synthase III family protein n=1 Tax=unclassified Micromonospora TaxID=2617518 RepID=UPI002E160EE9|nr:ketoacyl-ACP synthase III family protein [Micromonospora sp. NBC_01739]
MRFDDIWVAGTGATLGDPVPVSGAVAAGAYSAEAAASTGMISYSQSTQAPPEMAVSSGRQAIKAAAEHAVEIGPTSLHLHSHAGFQGIDQWSAACWIAGELIGTQLDTMPITVAAWSNGSIASLEVAANALTANPALPSALITVADRFGPPGDRFHTSPGMVFGDGAAAAVLTRGAGRFRLLSCVAEADTVLGGLARGDEPFRLSPSPEPADSRRRTREFLAQGEVSLRDIQTRTTQRVRSVVSRALDEAQVSPDQVDWMVTPFVGRTLYHNSFVRPLDFTPRNTLLEFGLTIGHLGAADQILGLHHLAGSDLLEPGSRILLIGTGMGFTFSAAVLTAGDD